MKILLVYYFLKQKPKTKNKNLKQPFMIFKKLKSTAKSKTKNPKSKIQKPKTKIQKPKT